MTVKLLGRVIISGEIEAKTGLHIGGSPGALAIGNVDLPVIRDARTNQPYIPGSSLKGKMRSLSEKLTGAPQNKNIGKDVAIHVAGGDKRDYKSEADYKRVGMEQYQSYWVNPIFGLPGEVGFDIPAPNRLLVRDVPLTKSSRDELLKAKTDLPFTEVKWEAAIDRVTSAATPRQIERVPAGAIFGPMELVFSAFLKEDAALFGNVLRGLQLVEDDYLGGHGSRGSGKVAFRALRVEIRRGETYETVTDARFSGLALTELISRQAELLNWVTDMLALA
ncbi:MAG: type III-A CRISPR-associated RAMP protein Csm3 [Chloroflexi bacterium]|nr:type III-A CRISPR-associated RAMP protein Csm3 [Chloroflexota bacterium]